MQQRYRRLGPVHHPLEGHGEGVLGDDLVLQAASVQVVAGEEAGRHPEAEGLDEGVVAEVVPVGGGEAARLEVDEHLAGPHALGPPDREVDLAGQHDRVVVEVGPQAALGHGSPARLEAREALEEHVDPFAGLAVQLGPLAFAQCAEVVADAVVAGDEARHGLVDELARGGVAAPADRQLDGLVGDRAASRLRGPGELLCLLGQEQALAAVHRAQQVLGHPERLAGGDALGHWCQPALQARPQLVAQPRIELRTLVGPGAQRLEDLQLRRVVLVHPGRLSHRLS